MKRKTLKSLTSGKNKLGKNERIAKGKQMEKGEGVNPTKFEMRTVKQMD